MENIKFESKNEYKLPEGATVLKKTTKITIEEIENGYVISKHYDIKYKSGNDTGYEYYTKKWYAKDNPMNLKIPDSVEAKSDSFVNDME